MNPAIRHPYEAWPEHATVRFQPCVCGKAKRHVIHRLGGRCSVCFTYHKHYELDSSRRCNACAP